MANMQQISEHIYQNTQRALLVLAISWASISAAPLASQAQSPTPSPDSGTSVIPVPRIVRPILRPDSQGESVAELQALLQLLGFYPGPVTGTYGELTQVAVEAFQAAAGLTSDGIVGPATWSRLLPAPVSETAPPLAQTVADPAPAENASAPNSPGEAASQPPTSPSSPQPTAPAASQPPAAGSTDDRPLLRLGAEGEAVSRLQRQLQELGFYQGAIDGIFGTQTEQAVKAAQENYDLTPDGIVGPATWSALGS